MKLVLKTRDASDKDYMYEVHKEGCAHLKFNKAQVFVTDKYKTAEDFIKVDMGTDIERKEYRIIPCA